MFMDNQRLAYRVADAARTLGIGKTKLYALAAAREIQIIKLGPRISVVPAASIQAFIERRTASISRVA